MDAIHKISEFSRTQANLAKMGAYYTDVNMCRRIRNLLSFPQGKEVCAIEPSCGDGRAIVEVTDSTTNEFIKLFGVELNAETYAKTKEAGVFDYLLNADFLNGVKISHGSFSFCFANPPYGEDERGRRLETSFVEKIFPYLKNQAVAVFVLPEYVIRDEGFLRIFFARFIPAGLFKFDEEVYAQFKQCVLLGVKRRALGYLKEDLESYVKYLSENPHEKLPFLPTEPVETPLYIVPSSGDGVEFFTTLRFDAIAALKHSANHSPLNGVDMGRRIEQPNWSAVDLGRPIVPLSADLCMLVSTAGGGQGRAGNEEDGTAHLQRGKVSQLATSHVESSDDGETQKLVELTSAKVTMKIVEQSGKISELT